jgi:hypothetical protein
LSSNPTIFQPLTPLAVPLLRPSWTKQVGGRVGARRKEALGVMATSTAADHHATAQCPTPVRAVVKRR